MKKVLFLAAMAFTALAACSDDDSGTTSEQHSYSAHMKQTCPEASPTSDYCVSKPVFDYLLQERINAGSDCLEVTFEDIDGTVRSGYLIRAEQDIVDCN